MSAHFYSNYTGGPCIRPHRAEGLDRPITAHPVLFRVRDNLNIEYSITYIFQVVVFTGLNTKYFEVQGDGSTCAAFQYTSFYTGAATDVVGKCSGRVLTAVVPLRHLSIQRKRLEPRIKIKSSMVGNTAYIFSVTNADLFRPDPMPFSMPKHNQIAETGIKVSSPATFALLPSLTPQGTTSCSLHTKEQRARAMPTRQCD